MNTIAEVHACVFKRMSEIYQTDEARSIADILISHYFEIDIPEIFIYGNKQPDPRTATVCAEAVERLLLHEPLQYVTGEAFFYGRTFFVNKNVLIPRPETEELVDKIIKNNEGKTLSILDIGTGSGCIAVTLAAELTQADVYAVDISPEALEVASKNSNTNKAKVQFVTHDILSNNKLPFGCKFDIIVSNPPYVCESEKAQMLENVLLHEPHLALFVNDSNPLLFYDAIANFALNNLKANGSLWFEINESLGRSTCNMLAHKGFKTELIKDFFGKDRIIKAYM